MVNQKYFCPGCRKEREIICDDEEEKELKYCFICRRRLISDKPIVKKIKEKKEKKKEKKIKEKKVKNKKEIKKEEERKIEDIDYDDEDLLEDELDE